MTRPVVISGAGLFVPADVAAELGPVLAHFLELARRDYRKVNPDVVETVEKIDLLGNWWRNKNLPSNLPSVDTPCSDPVQWITVKTAAEELSKTPRAVTGLLTRGSLHGELVGRTWRVSAASVKSRKAGSPCPN